MQSPNSQGVNSSQNARRSFKTSNKGCSPKIGQITIFSSSDVRQDPNQTRARNEAKASELNNFSGNMTTMNASSSTKVLPEVNEKDPTLY